MKDLTREELRILVAWGDEVIEMMHDTGVHVEVQDQQLLDALKEELLDKEQMASMDLNDCGDACKL